MVWFGLFCFALLSMSGASSVSKSTKMTHSGPCEHIFPTDTLFCSSNKRKSVVIFQQYTLRLTMRQSSNPCDKMDRTEAKTFKMNFWWHLRSWNENKLTWTSWQEFKHFPKNFQLHQAKCWDNTPFISRFESFLLNKLSISIKVGCVS